MPAVQAKSAQDFITLTSEDPDLTCRPPTAWDALSDALGLHAYWVVTTYRRLVTRERMAVLCHGSND
jgi:hypothetical protein